MTNEGYVIYFIKIGPRNPTSTNAAMERYSRFPCMVMRGHRQKSKSYRNERFASDKILTKFKVGTIGEIAYCVSSTAINGNQNRLLSHSCMCQWLLAMTPYKKLCYCRRICIIEQTPLHIDNSMASLHNAHEHFCTSFTVRLFDSIHAGVQLKRNTCKIHNVNRYELRKHTKTKRSRIFWHWWAITRSLHAICTHELVRTCKMPAKYGTHFFFNRFFN